MISPKVISRFTQSIFIGTTILLVSSVNFVLAQEGIEQLRRDLVIDQAFESVKKVRLPVSSKAEVKATIDKKEGLRAEEIIQSLIKPENRRREIDLAFVETNLGDFLAVIAEAAEINIVLDPELKGRVIDLHLRDSALEEVLVLLFHAYNLGMTRIGDSLYITSKEKIAKEHFVTRVVLLKNVKATEVKNLTQGLIDTITMNISEETNSVTLMGSPDDVAQVEQLIEKIDIPQRQVILEAKVIEINTDGLKQIGVDWSDSIGLTYTENAVNEELLGSSSFDIYNYTRTAITFDTLIKLLESESDAKILSNPRVTTLNNQEAVIFVGDKVPYTVTTVDDGVTSTSVEFAESGIKLTILPSIIQDDFVVLTVSPEVSFIYTFRGPGDAYPWIKMRETTAHARLRNNETFIIGGILSQEDKKDYYKVPMLGDIPFLGNLFSHQQYTVEDTELIITVTPRIVSGK